MPCSSRKQIRRRGTHNKWEPMNGSRKSATLIDQRDSPYDTREGVRETETESGEGTRTRSEIRCRFTQTKNSQEVVDVCPLERFVATSSTVCPEAAATPRLASSCSPFANSLPTIRQTSSAPLSHSLSLRITLWVRQPSLVLSLFGARTRACLDFDNTAPC